MSDPSKDPSSPANSAIDTIFDPARVEPRIYAAWEASGAFEPSLDDAKGTEAAGNTDDAFCIVIPPPNVTGSLHIGHALNNTLQDVLTRFHRMQGKRVLWQPGTDHAGIATQMVVERQLAQNNEPTRQELGREDFLKRVWAWKEESGGTITKQLRRLGASCAWGRERFTMDDGLSAAVRKVFVELYHQGLMTRAKRLVNWDPHFETAVSDLEVETQERSGQMWHFKYPLAGGETYEYVEKDADGNEVLRETRDYISIATTRPETMLGDGAVAVHPCDERYAPIVGKLCEIPVGPKEHRRLIPIITDEYPDPDFGSGAVKITGAHDQNDYGVAKRNQIPLYRLMDTKAALRSDGAPYAQAVAAAKVIQDAIRESGSEPDENAVDAINLVPDDYRGLDRFAARKKVIADVDSEGLMIMVEDKKIQTPMGDRSGVVIEPMLTDQWFVDAKTLAGPALAAVRTGKTKFVPDNWSKTYFNWLDNIQPWCVSRQLWWGHRIPAWYGPDGHVFVAESADEAAAQANKHYGKTVDLKQDEDVLDTWFSSALWPFSTLGWPEKTDALETFYPTSVLVTAFDIIFFWVARMMMSGLHFIGDVPFRDVYITPLVLDEKGQKMSKSKGNTIDPLDVIDGVDLETLVTKRVGAVMLDKDKARIEKLTRKEYPDGIPAFGADAMRFTMAATAVQGQELRFSIERVAGYRNFGTKVWNASRLLQMNGCAPDPDFKPEAATLTVNKWIIGELARTAGELTGHLNAYRFADGAACIYRFAWNVFCDWYLELIKPALSGEDASGPEAGPEAGPGADARAETQACASWVLDHLLTLLHPFSPFITEELWDKTAPTSGRANHLMVQAWPTLPDSLIDVSADEEIDWLIRFVSEIRSVRSQMGLPAAAKFPCRVFDASDATAARVKTHHDIICRRAQLAQVTIGGDHPAASVQAVVDEARLVLPLEGFVDVEAEKARLAKEIAKIQGEIDRLVKKLSNEKFIAKAPEDVVAAERDKQAGYEQQKARLADALAQLDQAAPAG